eukprot:NODE_40_length_35084_cov_0.543519.p5 type:complete len:645 gc:universal NODE_40_length_35084_cov_0.543519:15535-17469(+)
MNIPTIDNYVSANAVFKNWLKKKNCVTANASVMYLLELQKLGIPLLFKDYSEHPLITLEKNSDCSVFYSLLKNYIKLNSVDVGNLDKICSDIILEKRDLTELLYCIQRKQQKRISSMIEDFMDDSIVSYDYKVAYLTIWTKDFSIKSLDLLKDFDKIQFLINSLDYILQYPCSDSILGRCCRFVKHLTIKCRKLDTLTQTNIWYQMKCIEYWRSLFVNGKQIAIKKQSSITANLLECFLFISGKFKEFSPEKSLIFLNHWDVYKENAPMNKNDINQIDVILTDAICCSISMDQNNFVDKVYNFLKTSTLKSNLKCDIIQTMMYARYDGKKLIKLATTTEDESLFKTILLHANLYDSRNIYKDAAKLFYSSASYYMKDNQLFLLLEHHKFLTEAHLFENSVSDTAGIEWIKIKTRTYFDKLCYKFDPYLELCGTYDDCPDKQETLSALIRLNRAFYAKIPVDVFYANGVVGFLLVMLSCFDKTIQAQARFHLDYIVKETSRSDMPDKTLLVAAVNTVRNWFSIPFPNEQNKLEAIPYVYAYFVSNAIQMKKDHLMYTQTMLYLFKSPVFTNEPPFFKNLFKEATLVRRKHRLYVIELLSHGLKSHLDKSLYFKWHVMEVLDCFAQTFLCTPEERCLIQELLVKIN